eukprot:13920138-Alexandrium_andersonii.AAC.1
MAAARSGASACNWTLRGRMQELHLPARPLARARAGHAAYLPPLLQAAPPPLCAQQSFASHVSLPTLGNKRAPAAHGGREI